jgi:tryptophan-rich hypothetical protein
VRGRAKWAIGMNKINPKKLLRSKWTAVHPTNKEKHFLITELKLDDEGEVIHCLIEAVLTKREEAINWQDLKDSERWVQGWT